MAPDNRKSEAHTPALFGDFAISIEFEENGPVVAIRGDIDFLTAPTVASIISALVSIGHVRISIDLAGTTFVGGDALGTISAASERLASVGGSLSVRSASATARRLFALPAIGLAESVRFVDSPRSDLGAEQRIGDRTAVLQSPRASPADLLRSVVAPASCKVIDAALQLVTVLASATVDGADGVSVTLARGGQMITAASSNEIVLRMDQHQYQTGEGPCLSAASEGHWFHVESLADEERWPDFVPLARGEGIASVLSTPLLIADRPLGALNIYSTTDRAFGVEQQELAALFATQAATILTDAGVDLVTTDFALRISEALMAREVIAQAQGVVMDRDHVTSSEAAAVLHHSARTNEVSVLVEATNTVASTNDANRTH